MAISPPAVHVIDANGNHSWLYLTERALLQTEGLFLQPPQAARVLLPPTAEALFQGVPLPAYQPVP